MYFRKKALSPILTTMLLLLVASVSLGFAYQWFVSFETDFRDKYATSGYIDLLSLKTYGDSYYSVVSLRNFGSKSFEILELQIDSVNCPFTSGVIESELYHIVSNCTINVGDVKTVKLTTNKGVDVKTFTVKEAYGLIFVYETSNVCSLGGTKIAGLHFINYSHVEQPSLNNFGFSLCARHDEYTMTNTCSGTYERLFYIGGITDSHIYLSNSSVAPELYTDYYDWQELCIGTSASSIEINYSSNDLAQYGFSCLGSYDQDDYNGGVVGTCIMYPDKIWVRVS